MSKIKNEVKTQYNYPNQIDNKLSNWRKQMEEIASDMFARAHYSAECAKVFYHACWGNPDMSTNQRIRIIVGTWLDRNPEAMYMPINEMKKAFVAEYGSGQLNIIGDRIISILNFNEIKINDYFKYRKIEKDINPV